MAVSYGFYNSSSGDRKYDAQDLGRLFDGLISDGVYANVGNALMIEPTSPTAMSVRVKTGRAWFKNTWTVNDSVLVLPVAAAHSVHTRIDSVILKVDLANRTNTISVKTGTASASPSEPVLTQGGNIWEFALGRITIKPGVTAIVSGDIRNNHGTDKMPFVTNVMPSIDVSGLFQEWASQHDQWAADTELAFVAWFNSLTASLEGNVAANLAAKILSLETQLENLTMYTLGDTLPGVAKRYIYRGKNLGSSLTTTQKNNIKDGSFKDLFIGDYWIINNIRWRIVDFNYWYKTGSPAVATNHIVVMPDTNLYQQRMNSRNVVTGAYLGSEMFDTGLAIGINTIVSAFGINNVPVRYISFDNQTGAATGIPLGTTYQPVRAEIPTEEMITGQKVVSNFGRVEPGSVTGFPSRSGGKQLAIYEIMGIRMDGEDTGFWLRDTASKYAFACIYLNGMAGLHDASHIYGVRPVFAVNGMG